MYSMNRTSAPIVRPNSIRSTSSSSLTPRITTVSILSASKPAARRGVDAGEDRAHARRTGSGPGSGRGCSVSRLTVMRCRPAARSAAACGASSTPLVVSARSRMAGRAASCRRAPVRSRRRSGSPPVRRTRSTPRAAEGVGDGGDLLEGQQRLARQPGVVRLRHAVLAAEVAAVGDGDAQAAQRTAEAVENRHGLPSLSLNSGYSCPRPGFP